MNRNETNGGQGRNGEKNSSYVTFPIISNTYARCEAMFVLIYVNKDNKLTDSMEAKGVLNRDFTRDIMKLGEVLTKNYIVWKSGGAK